MEIRVVGDLEVGGERGRVIFPTGVASSITATDYKDPQKTVKKITKEKSNIIPFEKPINKIIVLGGLGVSARRDRDPDRVMSGRGIIYALPAHISSDKPLVVRKYEKGS